MFSKTSGSNSSNYGVSACADWPAGAGASGQGQARSWGRAPADEGDDAQRSPRRTPVGDIGLLWLVDSTKEKKNRRLIPFYFLTSDN